MGTSLGRPGHLRLRRHRPARAGLLHRHPPADGLRVAARGPRLQLHPHRPGRPLPAHARARGVLPDGLGRQRPAHRASGPEPLRRPLRPGSLPVRGPRLHAAGKKPDPKRQMLDQPAQLRRGSASQLDRRPTRRSLRGAVAHASGLSVDWSHDVHHHRRRRPSSASPAGLPAQLRPRRGLPPGPAPTGLWDVTFADRGRPGGARGKGVRRRLPPHRLRSYRSARRLGRLHRRYRRGRRRDRDHPSGAASPRLCRPDRTPRRRALPVTCSGRRRPRRSSAWSSPSLAHPAGREPDKGSGLVDVLHLR